MDDDILYYGKGTIHGEYLGYKKNKSLLFIEDTGFNQFVRGSIDSRCDDKTIREATDLEIKLYNSFINENKYFINENNVE